MNSNALVWLVVLILIIVGGGWFFYSYYSAPEPPPVEEEVVKEEPTAEVPTSVTVTYGPDGFSPSPVMVRVGGTVTWIDENPAADMWIGSAMHPTHSVYSGTTLSEHCPNAEAHDAFDQCKTGASYSFTFNKPGTWGYHNHVQANHVGQVIVVE